VQDYNHVWGNLKGCKELKVVCTLVLLGVVLSFWIFIVHTNALLDQLDCK
jgi:hypothetical protein